MFQRYATIIFLLFSVCCCNQYISGRDKYLPEEITDNKDFYLRITYDRLDRIKEIHSLTSFGHGQKRESHTIYEYYPNGLFKEVKSEAEIRPDSVGIYINMVDKYNYQVSDTLIAITLAKRYSINGELNLKDTLSSSKLYLNKDKLLYKMVSIDDNTNIMTTIDTIEYAKNKEVVKVVQTTTNKWGDLSIYTSNEVIASMPQKNVFSDVAKSKCMQLPLERQWFYFFANEAPTFIKISSKIITDEDKDKNDQNLQFSYELDNNGYPVKIHVITLREGEEHQKTMLSVKYKKSK